MEREKVILDARDWNDGKGPVRIHFENKTLEATTPEELDPYILALKRAQEHLRKEEGIVRCTACRVILFRIERRSEPAAMSASLTCGCGEIVAFLTETEK